MRKGMLAYYKLILEKVSFNRKLFLKELWKTNKLLSLKERYALLNWLRDRFSDTSPDLILHYQRSLKNKMRPLAFIRA